ncbi:TonB-dependent receptor [Pendulispora brunnea]|uniref:TonB-dependent receptor n=1 Tax=Pendulispora brunnea TaxID=2905690 RepID=A0ABZ2K5B4_9BACT
MRTKRRLALVLHLLVALDASHAAAQTASSSDESKTPKAPNDASAKDKKEPAEVTVRGKGSPAQRLVRSAESVTVVDLRRAKEQTVDMGEVLARTQGISVARDGGLGSSTRFSLNGLSDEQIRFFLDGVPLASAGFPFGIANVPVNLIERVEVYRGVVPLRFGADALGGAVNLVSLDSNYAPRLSASYQTGSNGIYRLSVDGRTRDIDSGFVFSATAFLDRAKNNYDVDVNATNAAAHLEPVTVPRFHDGYWALGGAVEAGVVDRPWARRLTARVFATGFDKDIQSNLIMTLPYGDVTRKERVYGGTVRYEQPLAKNLELETLANYSRRFMHFTDVGAFTYDWYGRRVGPRLRPGEVEGKPRDQVFWQDAVFARALVTWTLAKDHVLRFAATPSYTVRTGDERADTPLQDVGGAGRLFTLNSGVEYEMNLLEGRLQNIFFVKDYVYRASSNDEFGRSFDVNEHRFGIGNAIRYRVNDWLYAKASYERATRLPSPDETFGDGALIKANPQLEPEESHNINVGPHIEVRRKRIGDITLDVNGFFRDTDNLINVFPATIQTTYQNIFAARAIGVEAGGAWTAPGRFVTLDGSVTYNDFRNTATEGPFAPENGDRVVARPYFFGSWGARFRFRGLPGPNDSVEPYYVGRYVHSFFRAWESQGATGFKDVVDAQVTHAAGVTWAVFAGDTRVASTFEVDNLTDARVFDIFGAQRPGRQFFVKIAADVR